MGKGDRCRNKSVQGQRGQNYKAKTETAVILRRY